MIGGGEGASGWTIRDAGSVSCALSYRHRCVIKRNIIIYTRCLRGRTGFVYSRQTAQSTLTSTRSGYCVRVHVRCTHLYVKDNMILAFRPREQHPRSRGANGRAQCAATTTGGRGYVLLLRANV
jgi:hypothetical protein